MKKSLVTKWHFELLFHTDAQGVTPAYKNRRATALWCVSCVHTNSRHSAKQSGGMQAAKELNYSVYDQRHTSAGLSPFSLGKTNAE